jgi:UDP-N-acetylmuramoylalanine--D-glutamate ligase
MKRETLVDAQQPISALVVGLGREGTALSRFLAEQGVRVSITDAKPAKDLAKNMAALDGLPITYILGDHPLTMLGGVDIVFVSPGIPLGIPLLAEARRRGLPLSSETRLFTRLCPAPIVGVTGSSGKTTTTVLVGEMLEAAGCRTWIGGNIGRPLIGHLDEIDEHDVVIMELSSFQLEFFADWTEKEQTVSARRELAKAIFDPAGWSPPVAALLNLTPNHLDRHGTMEAYTAAKAQILQHQHQSDVAVVNLDDSVTRGMVEALGQGQRVLWFSMERPVTEGAYLHENELLVKLAGRSERICKASELRLLGSHNVANTLAACALAAVVGAPVEALRQAAISFRGVEHRLELVRDWHGIRWYNDSIATAPERTVAALQALDAPMVLLAGGRDKHLSWHEMADLTWNRVHDLVLFGEAAQLVEMAMRNSQHAASGACRIHQATALEQAVEVAARVARPGDIVLLSPGGTSFDAYRDYEERGDHFRQLVNELE